MINETLLNDKKTLDKLREMRLDEDTTIINESSLANKKYTIKTFIKNIFSDMYKPYCYMCKKEIVDSDKSYVCDSCLEIYKQYKVDKFFYDRDKEAGFSVYRYDGVVRYLIQKLKFNKDKKIAIALSDLCYEETKKFLLRHHISYMVPIPIHKKRLRERGFNQSELIAKRFYEKTNVSYKTKIVGRTKFTTPQSLIKNKDRAKNIEGSFEVLNKDEVIGKDILIVDDIYTTGSTINECKKVLMEAGARHVYFMTCAVAPDKINN